MLPLEHPHLSRIDLVQILHALADRSRLAIVGQLARAPGNCGETVRGARLDHLPRSTATHHFRVLREAGLIHSEKRGNELHNQVRLQEVEQRFPGLLQTVFKSMGRRAARRTG